MINAGLVLEGGGMKGLYTAGVLDFLMEKDMYFSKCYGVSAGACHLCSYISKQKDRAHRISIDYLDDKNYCSVRSLITTGDLFNVDMCYRQIPDKLNPYDFKKAANYEGTSFAVATNIETGEAEYFPMKEMHRDIVGVQASASLPLVSRNVKIGNGLYLDGGFSDAIPIKKSIEDGNSKNFVVLTKEVGYIRKPASKSTLALVKARYAKYPKVYELMRDRHIIYNETLEYLELQEKEGRAFVLRPQYKSDVNRIEKDKSKLEKLYRQGYEEAKANYDRLKAYLEV